MFGSAYILGLSAIGVPEILLAAVCKLKRWQWTYFERSTLGLE
jgi:hypothetical protein